MRSRTIVLFALLFEFGTGCKRNVQYYCDKDTPCLPRYPDRPYCDLTGEYEPDGIRNTCVANPYDGGTVGGPDGGTDSDGALFDGQPPNDGNDQPDPIVEDIAHVPAAKETAGTADLAISGMVVIDTSALTYDGGTPPAGAQLDASGQDGGTGVALAILHVRSLSVATSGTLKAVGTRALVIIASGNVTIDGVIDASATRGTPGAGGSGPGAGTGQGHDGSTGFTKAQPGAGGGGFADGGGNGGADVMGSNGGTNGFSYGDPSQAVLFGGSGGGSSTSCAPNPAGAGGGAVQIYSGTSIWIQVGGGINVGGGGAGGGKLCSNLYGGGAGGGSGGAVFLQAPSVMLAGTIAANGGGGGAGGNTESNGTNGQPGADATLNASPAAGGFTPGSFGTAGAGGAGAAASGLAQEGANASDDLVASIVGGGGGGGSVGRVTVQVHSDGTYENTGVTSPPATKSVY